MDVKAILMVGGHSQNSENAQAQENVGAVPLAYLDVLGLPVLERILQRLQRFGVSQVALISEAPPEAEPFARRATLRPDLMVIEPQPGQFWTAAENAFSKFAEDGAELVLAVRIGPYVEIDYEELIQHHLDKRCRITRVEDAAGGSLDIFVVTASRRNDATVLFRSQLQTMRAECEPYQLKGYCNRLRGAADLRQLGLDGLLGKNHIRPVGTEVKPGVWLGDGAKVHRKARVVAPAYVGTQSKIRAAALVTRGTIVEHHAEVDCGTVIENSTVLPYSYVGAGLDVMHSVVGFGRLNHLLRNADVEIADTHLIGMSPTSPISRTVGSAAALFAFLPKQVYRAFFAPAPRKSSTELPESMGEPAAALDATSLEVPSQSGTGPSEFVVARRYGDQ